MALEEKKQQLTQKGGVKPSEKPVSPKDVSVFGGRSAIPTGDLRSWARSDEAFKSTNVPQTERMQIVQKYFGKESFINKQRTQEKLKKLETEKYQTRTDKKIKELDKDIKVLKGILNK